QEKLLARIRKRSNPQGFKEAPVWAISPLGIELILPSQEKSNFTKGTKVDLELVVFGRRTEFSGVACVSLESEGHLHLGIRFSNSNSLDVPDHERRSKSRWLCSEEYLPVAHCPSPGRFDDVIHLKLRDVSGSGLQLATSLRNKYLIPGMELILTIVFPLGPIVQAKVEIVRTSVEQIGALDKLIVGVKFTDIGEKTRQAFGQYLIQFSDSDSLHALRSDGFHVNSVANASTIYYLKSEEDYLKVLQLRFNANQGAKQLGRIQRPEDTAELTDAKSRILVVKRKDEVIGTGRFRFPLIDEKLEFEKFVDYPKNFPRRDQIIEVTRLATDDRFRGSDLFASILRFAAMTVASEDRYWIVATAMDKYIPYYTKIGFNFTQVRFDDPKWDGTQNLLIANSKETILGRKVHPLVWGLVWRDVSNYWITNGIVRPTRLDKIRISILKVLAPLGRVYLYLNTFIRQKT
ncbi:MAG: PilZ domain-containing protein, partial [Pseudomonadota bacterium]